jgi:hypothetical protein
MVQFKILSGKKAGESWRTRRFPVTVGRSPACELQIEEHGVWDEHFEVSLNPQAGFVLETRPDALVTINGLPAQRAVLRNGDLLEIGGARLQFWLAEAPQRSLQIREGLLWAVIAAVCAAQVGLIYWLTQ